MKKNSERKYIKIRGANEHNLKNIDVDIPRDEFVVLTGPSVCYDLYGGTEALYGVTFLLCKTILRADGKAECGEDRGAVPGDLH